MFFNRKNFLKNELYFSKNYDEYFKFSNALSPNLKIYHDY